MSAWCAPSRLLSCCFLGFVRLGGAQTLWLYVPGFYHLSKAQSEAMGCQPRQDPPRPRSPHFRLAHLFVLLVGLLRMSSGKEGTSRKLHHVLRAMTLLSEPFSLSSHNGHPFCSLCEPEGPFRVFPEYFEAKKVLVQRG